MPTALPPDTNAERALLVPAKAVALTNSLVATVTNSPDTSPQAQRAAQLRSALEAAQQLRAQHQSRQAEPLLVEILGEGSPDSMKQEALLELAMGAAEEKDWPRAQQTYAQFLNRWPNAPQAPEILLRQGRIFREMGLNNLALTKFYGVMTTALVLKSDAQDYYRRLVLLAQTEIAETHFQLGKYEEAADLFSRLLKQSNPLLTRPVTQFRLIRCLSALGTGRSEDTVAQCLDFLAHNPNAAEQPEIRFDLATAFKQLGRNHDALQQTMTLLQEQNQRSREHPQIWAYWQQRAGNEIGNQFYREGDFSKALDVYLALAQLDTQPAWQLPAQYQIGLTYERLAQPQRALQSYQAILKRESELGSSATPALKEVLEMARWRAGFLRWQTEAESQVRPAVKPAPHARLWIPGPGPVRSAVYA